MIRVGEVQDRVTKKHEEFLILSKECPRQWVVFYLHQHAVSSPLPELSLRGPELLIIAAYDECGSLLFLFEFLLVRFCVLFSVQVSRPTRQLDTPMSLCKRTGVESAPSTARVPFGGSLIHEAGNIVLVD